MSDYELDDDESNDFHTYDESDEDTEDASETDMIRFEGEFTEMKEQMYVDKLNNLKDQLFQLSEGMHPEYLRKHKKLDFIYHERMYLNEAFLAFETERIEKEYVSEKKAAVREFENRKIELKENLILELEEKRKMIENERLTLELTSDSIEAKPLNHLLDETDILEDIKTLSKACNSKIVAFDHHSDSDSSPNVVDARIEDGKLNYDKKWFHRGQPVVIKSKDGIEFNAVLASIGNAEIWVKKTNDNSKVRVYLSNLQKGKLTLQRRAS
ncbi:sin3 histone deacetylase corepressor complex component SDS3-like isoform X2 [Leptotrombidium deliense]|uniref:Sin3 histone deacetylase corepressor complex component SDS3-like isoform X2 n=1 Tax=Leptotrombidium deliense TaxID=299467 RepID=A0A443SFZ9_9ACAR|nr:sin3 histone deacetylase corepressor complex component SDS3-like isoform X2 [Leptotrombidium deliense]